LSPHTAAAIGWLAAAALPLPVSAADTAACDSLDTARWILGKWVADDSISVEVSDGRDQGFTLRLRHAD
jgi:hypothetical protein